MPACPDCGAENPGHARFCLGCGTGLAAPARWTCQECGTENPENARFCLACGTPLEQAPAPQEVRKVVSIVFSDLKGSTSLGEKLDSEALREVMSRYFDAMRAELERHGAIIEKFIGDAIMAVFGLPRLHEDDALRAVRAAAGMQRALEELNDELDRAYGVRLANRTGVNTGEVVAGDAATRQRLVTGDVVNVAARLEQAAGEREVLLGDLTYRLVRERVLAEPVEPLTLKGKAEPVPAYRLLSVVADGGAGAPGRGLSPLVGREAELDVLTGALADAEASRVCRLAAVVGEAGVGKSRLTDELLTAVGGRATVLRGRCLPYGDGITFWPVVELARSAAGIVDEDAAAEAVAKLSALVSDERVAERMAATLGLEHASFPMEELFWGIRRFLEELAAERPVVAVVEDVHWAEPTLLELLEHLLDTVEGPVLLVCPARPELLERLPGFGEQPGASRVVLERLSPEESIRIVTNLLGQADVDPGVCARIVGASEGNPLFVEQMLSMMIDDGVLRSQDGRWVAAAAGADVSVPPTIHALLAARLDGLRPHERSVLEPASVAGYVFPQAAVEALVAPALAPQVGAELAGLARKQLVARAQEEGQHRFHHILIRDTTYDGILKRTRASLHERFVRWADEVNRDRASEYEEILGYHLEQAHRYLSELGTLDEHARSLGADGARRLASAGQRAFGRGDAPAAVTLLGRAASLLPAEHPERLALLPDYGEALLQTGRFGEAEAALQDAVTHAEAAGLRALRASAALVWLLVRLRAGDSARWREEAAREIAEAIEVFSEVGDDVGLARAWRLLSMWHGTACRFGGAAEASARSLEHARRAGDERQQRRAAMAYAAAAVFGPTPVDEAIARCEQAVPQVRGDWRSEGTLRFLLASLHAFDGAFDRARELNVEARTMLSELGLDVEVARASMEGWRVEMLAGDLEAAERELRGAYDLLVAIGEKYLLSTVAGLLAQTMIELDRVDEAGELGRLSQELALPDDVDTQALWRCVRGKLLARSGAVEEGERHLREAIAILEPTDALLFQLGAQLDLAAVLQLAGRDAEALAAVAAALDLAEQKGSRTLAAPLRDLVGAGR